MTARRLTLPFTGAAIAALLGLAGCGSAASPSPGASGSSSPPSSAATTAAGAPSAASAFADCSQASFGPALAPQGEPSDRHVYSAAPPMQIDAGRLYQATITTARGRIVLCLQPRLAPHTVNNFVALARNHFYDGLTFHRVVPGFVIQGGDPRGDGSGGPGYQFDDEPVRARYTAGALAMANAGPNTNGSQFFICTVDDTTQLQPLYNLFGDVQSGMDVVRAIQPGDVMQSVTVAQQQ